MTKVELINEISNSCGESKSTVESVLNTYFEEVKKALVAGDKIQIVGFGNFEVATRAAREGRNPATGEKVHINESKTVKFKAGKSLKDAIN